MLRRPKNVDAQLFRRRGHERAAMRMSAGRNLEPAVGQAGLPIDVSPRNPLRLDPHFVERPGKLSTHDGHVAASARARATCGEHRSEKEGCKCSQSSLHSGRSA